MDKERVRARQRFIEIMILTAAILVISSEITGEVVNTMFFFVPFLIVSMLYYFFISHFYLIKVGKRFIKILLFFIVLNMVAALFSAIVVIITGKTYTNWIYFLYYLLLYVAVLLALFPEDLGYSWS